MNNYRNEILNEFIDRYEKSSYYKGKSEKPRKISIVLHKKFPEYGHSFHYEETNELENIAFQLQSQGFVEFSKKSILGDRELILNQEENQKLANLRDTLLPKLMSGVIDVANVQL